MKSYILGAFSVLLLLSACGGGGGGEIAQGNGGGAPSNTSPGGNNTAGNGTEPREAQFTLTSTAFENGGTIPVQYTCDGQDISPPLRWSGAPEGTKSFALIMEDPDAPLGTFVHWIVFNIPETTVQLPENFPKQPRVGDILQGTNDFGGIGYGGPCPPRGDSPHRYYFKLYALSVESVNLSPGVTMQVLMNTIQRYIIGEAQIMATYGR